MKKIKHFLFDLKVEIQFLVSLIYLEAMITALIWIVGMIIILETT